MHQRIAALFASFAVTSAVMLVGWKLAFSGLATSHALPQAQRQTLAPPALQAVSTTPNGSAAGETIASR